MAYRFTNTDKWNDSWFSELKQLEKLLFMYMCDNCDIAGFIEANINRWSFDLGSSKDTIQGALKGLERGLIISELGDCIYLKNFLKHQKNLPLNEKNKAHLGIIKRFDLYKNKFRITNIEDFINQDFKPLERGYGIGIGKGNSKGIDNDTILWKKDFEIYKNSLRQEYDAIIKNEKWILERETFHPNLDILLTLKKSCVDFWATEAGWKNKKNGKTKDIDWISTFNNSLTQKMNHVYKQNNKQNGKNNNGTSGTSDIDLITAIKEGVGRAEMQRN